MLKRFFQFLILFGCLTLEAQQVPPGLTPSGPAQQAAPLPSAVSSAAAAQTTAPQTPTSAIPSPVPPAQAPAATPIAPVEPIHPNIATAIGQISQQNIPLQKAEQPVTKQAAKKKPAATIERAALPSANKEKQQKKAIKAAQPQLAQPKPMLVKQPMPQQPIPATVQVPLKPAPSIPKISAAEKEKLIAETPIAPVPTIEEKSKKADKAFLQWKVEDANSTVAPALRKLLTPQAIDFIIARSQVPLGQQIGSRKIDQRIRSISREFIAKYDPKKTVNAREMYQLLASVIEPQRLFEPNPQATTPTDVLYNKLLASLGKHETATHTTLDAWALRFLTSESVIDALPIIKAVSVDGRNFNEMTPAERRKALDPAITVVTNHFLQNLRSLQKEYNIELPGRLDEAIRNKISKFFTDKFIAELHTT